MIPACRQRPPYSSCWRKEPHAFSSPDPGGLRPRLRPGRIAARAGADKRAGQAAGCAAGARASGHGQRQGDILTEAEYSSANNLFNIGGDKFFRVSSDEGDIFLDKLEYFTLLESQKINDDGSGNNQRNQKLTKYDDNNVFSIWSDEEKIYGIRLDKNGNIISEKIELISTDILFFPDKEFIATWIKSANNSSYAAGYTMFNQEFNEKFSKTLFTTNSSYNLRMKIQIFSDTTFVVLLNSLIMSLHSIHHLCICIGLHLLI